MALSDNINTREFDKFCEIPGKGTAVRTCTEITGGSFDVSALPVGAKGPVKITATFVGTVSALFPAINQVDRASLSIRNESNVKTIYIVNTSGLSLPITDRWAIGPNETFNSDLDDTNGVHLVSDDNVPITILEIAT